MLDPLVLLASAGALALVALMVWLWTRRQRAGDDVFSIIGTSQEAAKARIKAPPVDLTQPIASTAQWRAMQSHADDAAYRRAVETLRLRYQLVNNPMLLPNTLRETMSHAGHSFREAVIRVAEDDGLRSRR